MNPRVTKLRADLGVRCHLAANEVLSWSSQTLGTGIGELDRALPWHGYPLGRISELINHPGGAAPLLALCAAAHASKTHPVIWITTLGLPEPRLFLCFGGTRERFNVLRVPGPAHYMWAAEQVLRSGVFRLIVLQGTHPLTGKPLFDPAGYRRWMAATAQGDSVLLILLEFQELLSAIPRPAALKLEVSQAGGGSSVKVMKAAGHSPGREVVIGVEALCSGRHV